MNRLRRDGHVVERHGEMVVRFAEGQPSQPVCAAGAACCCRSRAAPAEVPVAALALTEAADEGTRVQVSVAARGLSRVAVLLFALPLAVLVIAGWAGTQFAAAFGLTADPVAALAGLTASIGTLWLVARNGGVLLRMLELRTAPVSPMRQDQS